MNPLHRSKLSNYLPQVWHLLALGMQEEQDEEELDLLPLQNKKLENACLTFLLPHWGQFNSNPFSLLAMEVKTSYSRPQSWQQNSYVGIFQTSLFFTYKDKIQNLFNISQLIQFNLLFR